MRRLVAVLLASCATVPARAQAPTRCSCAEFGAPAARGQVPAVLVELSGLVASRTQPFLFAHNDSGDDARFFALSPDTGQIVRSYTLRGATNVDWEDVAQGPCPAGSCLYFGDVGDNRKLRSDYAVYRVVEPKVMAGDAPVEVAFERFGYRFPGGERHNAEALLADPVAGRLYLLTKADRGTPSRVFRFPLTLADGVELEPIATLAIPTPSDQQITAADVSPCGDAVLVRMYNRLVVFRRPPGAAFETVFTAAPAEVPVAAEDQGEAVAFVPSAKGFFTASESPKRPASLFVSGCR